MLFYFCCGKYGKLTFFLIFITVVYVLFERKLIKVRTIAIFCFVLFFIFYVFTVSRTSSDASPSDSMSIIDFLGIYFTSPPIAFGHLRPTISQYLCPNSLWTIYSYMGRFINGVTVEHDAFSEFVFVPVPTNVYTIMKPFYQDGGVFGVAFFALLYGIGTGLVTGMRETVSHFQNVCIHILFLFWHCNFLMKLFCLNSVVYSKNDLDCIDVLYLY